jgi:ABC-2 type transport system ATP-binding protein
MDAIKIDRLVKDYDKVRAVDGASFSVKEKEIFGLIGPNGAGKTTILRIVCGLLGITSGAFQVFGFDGISEREKIRNLLSYLPEEAGAYKNLTGMQYLKFMVGFFAEDEKRGGTMLETGIQTADLGDRIKDKIATYSKGMTRRLLVARALMVHPKLAVLDEPTAGLDVINAREIRKIIKKETSSGTTFLISSHNMLEVEFICDRIGLIEKGKIVDIGTPAELKQRYRSSNIEEVFESAIKKRELKWVS